jgi:hypothetical protein
MGNLKQRMIKAGTEFNYAEGVKVKASVAITADQIVQASGHSGPFMTVRLAHALNLATGRGRLFVAKHAIPINGYGVVLPWKLITMTTTGGAIGDDVYLSDTTAGGLTLTIPNTSGDVIRVVATIVTVGDATGGRVLFSGDMTQDLTAVA